MIGAVKSDAGFTLVEVLVALTIASMLLTAVGGLIAFAGALSQRTAHQNLVLDALVRIQSLSDQLEASRLEWSPRATADGADRYVLRTAEGAGIELWAIADTGKKSSVLLWGGTGVAAPGQVDLSAFQSSGLEAFIEAAGQTRWVAADRLGADTPRMLRISLADGHRKWFPILWVSQKVGVR